MKENITGWAESVEILSRVSRKHPQSAYAGLQKSIHQKCSLVQRVTPGISNDFSLV